MWGNGRWQQVQRTIGVESGRNSPKDAELPRQLQLHTIYLLMAKLLLFVQLCDDKPETPRDLA